MQLVGRSVERDAIVAALDRAARGQGGLVVLVGEHGSGRTTMLEAAAGWARERGLPVRALSPGTNEALPDDVHGLVTLDDVDATDAGADLLRTLAAQASSSSVLVISASAVPFGLGAEVRLTPLAVDDTGRLIGDSRPDVVRAVWTAARGLPGAALRLASGLTGLRADADPVVALALAADGGTEFLDVDVSVVRLLEIALTRAVAPADRAVLLANLARELMGDSSTLARRRELVDEAAKLALEAGDDRTRAHVLEARLVALWAPDVDGERAAAATQVVVLAQAAGDVALERKGMFWRFVGLVEAGRIQDAENALRAYERIGLGDAADRVMVLGRYGMLALLRGRYDDVHRIAREVADLGMRARVPDTGRLVGTLLGHVAVDCGPDDECDRAILLFREAARRFPGHLYETTAALLLAQLARRDEAARELQQVLPRLLAASGLADAGPRWLGAAVHAAEAAVLLGDLGSQALLYEALLPYAGRFALWGGANSCAGPVDHYLGRLAQASGRPDAAVGHLAAAEAVLRHEGLLPGLVRTLAALGRSCAARNGPVDGARAAASLDEAHALAARLGMDRVLRDLSPPADHWSLRREGTDWVLEAGPERARLRDARGLAYLAVLLRTPRVEVEATSLVAGVADGAAPRAGTGDPLLDRRAIIEYRARLALLEADAEAADRVGDVRLAEQVETERQAILSQLGSGLGLGGRARTFPSETERARISVTKAIRVAVERIEEQAPLCTVHLRASVRTGRRCRYDPATGGPVGWATT